MWQAAQTIFLSIVLESLPFVILGVLISSLIQKLVSKERLLRLLPRNGALAVVVSSMLGFFMPVCDCGTIPIARSLIAKGVPHSVAMTFTLAAPVVNPLTMVATYVAFGLNTTMMWMRVAVTLGIAITIGWTLQSVEQKKRRTIVTPPESFELPMLNSAPAAAPTRPQRRSVGTVIRSVIEHAVTEFFEVGSFVVLSALVAACLQTYLPGSALSLLSAHPFWSVVSMMVLGSALSLCSEADSFIARSLASVSTTGGVLSFLVIGQMIDVRNVLLLPRVFPRWAVVRTFVMAIFLTLLVGTAVNLL